MLFAEKKKLRIIRKTGIVTPPLGDANNTRGSAVMQVLFYHAENDCLGGSEMTKACLKCRYCRVKLGVWFSAVAVAISITAIVVGVVPFQV